MFEVEHKGIVGGQKIILLDPFQTQSTYSALFFLPTFVYMYYLRLILFCHASLQMTQLNHTNIIIKNMHRPQPTSCFHRVILVI